MSALLHPLMPDAHTREFLSQFSLAPDYLVDDRLRAAHLSRQRGDGLEFHQYRPYQNGDDLRLVDWRLYARSDRLFVREAQQESRLNVCLLIDATASMQIMDGNGQQRLQVAKKIAAALGWLAKRGQHPVMALAFGDVADPVLAPASGMRQLERLCHWLEQLSAAASWPSRATQHRLMQAIPARSLVIALSDFAALDDAQRSSWQDLMSRAHTLIGIQLLTQDELRFNRRGTLEIIEPESGARRLVDAKAVAESYSRRLTTWLDDVRDQHVRLGARFVRTQTETLLNETLAAALSPKRSASARLLVDAQR